MTIDGIRKHVEELKYFCKGKPYICKLIIEKADNSLIKCLCECAHNILKGNIELSKKDLKKLKRYRRKLHDLVNKKVSVKRKKKILQTGGILPAILGPLLPAILPIASKILLGQ